MPTRFLPLLALAAAFAAPHCAAQPPPPFSVDVMAVLSKAGCNMGACHGNLNGKGGLKLSLRGESAERDWETLTHEHGGRRIDRFSPQQSMILLKPSGGVAHQGGVRFGQDSLPYRILHDWIAAGCPPPSGDEPEVEQIEVSPRELILFDPEQPVQLEVTALLAGGERRDVTELAVFETTNMVADVTAAGLVEPRTTGETTILVRFLQNQAPVQLAFLPPRPDFTWHSTREQNYVDRNVNAKLKSLRIIPSPPADDGAFVRRAYLDALGVLPAVEEVLAFIGDGRADKRERLIDDLLAREEFAEHWALKWSDLLRNEEKVLDERGVDVFHDWIRKTVAEGMPVDRFVRELLTARGSTYEVPPANFYRANRDAVTRAETSARLFLGTRLGCAKCHNHPFEKWTQDDYYSWAANFARVDYEIVKNERRDKLDKHEFVGEQIVLVKDEGESKNARTGRDAAPKFLGGPAPKLSPKEDRLPPLAEWVTSPDNELFARSQVNWIWYHLMGRGLVEPIDDFRATNPASNEPLLEALAEDFVTGGFDLRRIVRTIMTSETYGRSSEPNETNAGDETNFSRAIVRRLTAEQLLDAQCKVIGAPADFAGYPDGMRAGELPGVGRVRRREHDGQGSGDRFLRTFGKPDRLLACECERSNETTLTQAFTLIGGESLNDRLAREDNRLAMLARSELSSDDVVERLYWSALARGPTGDERQAALELLAAESDRFIALQDLAWALVNAKEFVFRR